MTDFLLPTIVFTVLTAFAPFFVARLKDRAGWILAIGPALFLAVLLKSAPGVLSGGKLTSSVSWISEVGINFSFYVDSFGLTFASLVCLIGAFIIIYSGGYNSHYHYTTRFYVLMLAFMASMVGVVLSDNLILLFVFWELTSITSYLLIGINHEEEANVKAALQALVVTAGGGLVMLMGIVMLGNIAGTLELSELIARGEVIRQHPLYFWTVICFFVGCLTKSAQFPFHFWLPNAMAAPTPASAFIHSATMVKAGVFLLFRLTPVLGGTEIWFRVLTSAGAITMVLGALFSLLRHDMKQVLAYTTISALGTITMLIGVGTEASIVAAFVFMVAHAFYKGSLFLITGMVDHGAGTRDLRQMGGLRKLMPITCTVAFLGVLSLGGMMPTLSFLSKELMLEAALHNHAVEKILPPAIVFTGAAFLAVAIRLFVVPFFGPLKHAEGAHVHEAPLSMWIGPGILTALGVFLGITCAGFGKEVITPVYNDILHGHGHELHFHVWHGVTKSFLLSLTAYAVGVALFFMRRRIFAAFEKVEGITKFGPEKGYDLFMGSIYKVASFQTRIIQTGYLRHYMMVTVLFALLMIGFAMLREHTPIPAFEWEMSYLHEYGIALMIVGGCVLAILANRKLMAIVALTMVGFGVGVVYVYFSAPDLAMTQVLVETLATVMFALVLAFMPPFRPLGTKRQRALNLTVAAAFGTLMSVLTWISFKLQASESISSFFAETSYLKAHGKNVVNVILVDYRGWDTFGEILVISIASIGVVTLLAHSVRTKKGAEVADG
ncbi:MAG: DUF4040 domain-containing protein [Verrucomicrobia bacterium]|nr:DUF4040 domain-containing protein [Verrucomicrobiota bacterium]